MRVILIDEAEASLGQAVKIFNSPNRVIIGMVNDYGLGLELQTVLNAFNELKDQNQDVLNRLEILEGKLENVDGNIGLVRVNQLVEVDANISDMTAFMGYGSWELFGRGRITLCSGSGTDERNETMTFVVATTGGEYKHVLSIAELPEHAHRGLSVRATNNWKYGPNKSDDEGLIPTYGDSNKTGGNEAHNNLPPYVVIQRWKRIS